MKWLSVNALYLVYLAHVKRQIVTSLGAVTQCSWLVLDVHWLTDGTMYKQRAESETSSHKTLFLPFGWQLITNWLLFINRLWIGKLPELSSIKVHMWKAYFCLSLCHILSVSVSCMLYCTCTTCVYTFFFTCSNVTAVWPHWHYHTKIATGDDSLNHQIPGENS